MEMASEFNSAETSYYFERFGFCGRQIDSPPIASLGMVVVLPAYNEESLLQALKTLYSAEQPQCGVEVIVVFNSKEGEDEEVVRTNALAADIAVAFGREIQEDNFRIHVLNCLDLPKKKAGVGL